jgi:hypothetical protein
VSTKTIRTRILIEGRGWTDVNIPIDFIDDIIDARLMHYGLTNPKVESVTQGVGEERSCETCHGTGKEICNNPDHGFIDAIGGETGRLGCPCCGHDPEYLTKYVCPDCSGTGKIITPPAEDSLAKARRNYDDSYGTTLRNEFADEFIHKLESAIREEQARTDRIKSDLTEAYKKELDDLSRFLCERDEKMSQMMTVEEYYKWCDDWRNTYGTGTFSDYLRQKIKERNEER